MRTLAMLMMIAPLAACGGGETPPPKTEEPKEAKAEEPKEEPKKEEAPAEPDLSTMDDDAKKAALMEWGEKVYKTGGSAGVACSTCHQEDGKGQEGIFPPLAGSKEEMGDCKTHAGQVINGQTGEIVVQGVTYNGAMPPIPSLSDFEIAAVITYERNSWGNDYGICLPEDVKAARP